MNIISDFIFNLDKEIILKTIDCYKDSEVYEEVCETYDILVEKLKNIVSPKAIFDFRERPESYTMEDIKDCSHIVFCLITLGEQVSKETEKYFNTGLYLEGMLLDTMSDFILDAYSSQIYKKICKEAKQRDVGLSCKLSPGNANFHISNQKYILEVLNGREVLNIDVTEGFMLKPVKSVSFIFGADKSLNIPPSDHECSRCTSTICKMRKEPYIDKKVNPIINLTVLTEGKKLTIVASREKSIADILIENGIKLSSPCAGNGTCGKCKVKMVEGNFNRVNEISNLKENLVRKGWTLACTTFLEGDCSIVLEDEEEGFNIIDTFEDINIEKNPIYEFVNIELEKKSLKGSSLTEAIDLKLNKKYTYSLKALKSLSSFINFHGIKDNKNLLFGKDNFNIIVYGDTVVNCSESDSSKAYGIALDIGTTTIALSLIDLISGKSIKSHSLLNSQSKFGADVISRIQNSNEGKLNLLNLSIKNDIINGIKELSNLANIQFDEIYHIAIAGNTTMLYFLLGLPPESLGLIPFNTVTTSMLQYGFEEIFQYSFIDCKVTILPGISAYVGADIISGMLHCNFHDLDKTSLLIDVGTNGEMAIGNKEKILCLATAAGPAFEGANISCGIGSIKGAICSVELKDGQVIYHTIGNERAKGICGSAVIDTVATCVTHSIIDETGRFDEEAYEDGTIKLVEDITFNQKDVREVQLAKSAIRSGIEILLQEFNCTYTDINTVFLAGGFGKHMNIENAAIIGLIPSELKEKVKTVGNTSLGGAVRYLTDKGSQEALKYILSKTKYIDISSNKNFNDLFINNMLF